MTTAIETQRQFWNEWNTTHREQPHSISYRSRRQAEVLLRWLHSVERRDLEILEVGCASGWFAEQLADYGTVTATDLADELIARAQKRAPHIRFIAGDFAQLDFRSASFDVVVHLEVLSHVANQPAFMAKIAGLLKPGGHLMMATQNAFTLSRLSEVLPPKPGQLRRWVTIGELKRLALPHFEIRELRSIIVDGDRGILRWVNAPKVNRLASLVLGSQARYDTLKERLGWGHTLMLHAQRFIAMWVLSFHWLRW